MTKIYFDPVADHDLEQNNPFLVELQMSMASTLDYPFNEMIKKVMRQISKEYLDEYIKNLFACRQAGIMLLCRVAYPNPVEVEYDTKSMAEKIFSSMVDMEWLRRMEILDYFISDAEALCAPDIQLKVNAKTLMVKLEMMDNLNRPNGRLLKFLKQREAPIEEEIEESIPERM